MVWSSSRIDLKTGKIGVGFLNRGRREDGSQRCNEEREIFNFGRMNWRSTQLLYLLPDPAILPLLFSPHGIIKQEGPHGDAMSTEHGPCLYGFSFHRIAWRLEYRAMSDTPLCSLICSSPRKTGSKGGISGYTVREACYLTLKRKRDNVGDG